MQKKVILIIMDGWGKGLGDKSDAIACANTPFIDSCYKQYPHAELVTHGFQVGLPNGQMGNSEVGHLNIGAGRIVYQDLSKIDLAIENNELATNHALIEVLDYVKEKKVNLHIMGLVSNGGVHSSIVHLKELCNIINQNGISNSYLHAFTDGRDTDPNSGFGFIEDMEQFLINKNTQLVSAIGRYFAMDRDKRWERVKLAYDLLVHGIGNKVDKISSGIQQSYSNNITDEFLKPIILSDKFESIAPNDAVICFNFRTDRCREITEVLTQVDFKDHDMATLPLKYATMTNYNENFKNVTVFFEKQNLQNTLGEVISHNGLNQLRMAETEKYPHVTFFFNGGLEEPFANEKRILMPSPKVATYDLQPKMSALELKEALLNEIQKNWAHFICINFANTDMVGHTGVFSAVVTAAETVDGCVREIVNLALQNNYSCLVTADHGNADYMINKDGSPNTAHTKNPVPIFFIDNDNNLEIKDGNLGDLAPTVLKLLNLAQPIEMTGTSLVY